MSQKDETNGADDRREIWDSDEDEIQKRNLSYVTYVYSDRRVATFWRKALLSCLSRWKDGGDSRFLEIFFIPN